VPKLVASAHGTVVELGPAVGNQLPRFDMSKITHIYGIEPNKGFEEDLHLKVKELDIGDKYTPLMCSIEDKDVLSKFGIQEGSVDCIVSIQVLCSVKDVNKVAKELYGLLKSGGEVLLWEHQRSRDPITRVLQSKSLSLFFVKQHHLHERLFVKLM
jgi:SAM-dependent methyltransferase